MGDECPRCPPLFREARERKRKWKMQMEEKYPKKLHRSLPFVMAFVT